MIRRDFIKNTGFVSAAIGLAGQAAIFSLLKGDVITFPNTFSDVERKQVLDLFKEVKPHMNNSVSKRSAIKMLEPKELLERNEEANGDYETIYRTKTGGKVSLNRKEGKNYIVFL